MQLSLSHCKERRKHIKAFGTATSQSRTFFSIIHTLELILCPIGFWILIYVYSFDSLNLAVWATVIHLAEWRNLITVELTSVYLGCLHHVPWCTRCAGEQLRQVRWPHCFPNSGDGSMESLYHSNPGKYSALWMWSETGKWLSQGLVSILSNFITLITFPILVLFKVWSPDQQQQHHLGTCHKFKCWTLPQIHGIKNFGTVPSNLCYNKPYG